MVGPDNRRLRDGFALTGPSQPLDLRYAAVRPDIADVRLADRVFAPHYAAPLPKVLLAPAELRAGSSRNAESLVTLFAGDTFEMLDQTGGVAWGIAGGSGLVGYLEAAALGL